MGWGEEKVPEREVVLKAMANAIDRYIFDPTDQHFEAMKLAHEVWKQHEETQ